MIIRDQFMIIRAKKSKFQLYGKNAFPSMACPCFDVRAEF